MAHEAIPIPDRLPFLESLSWFDRQARRLSEREMLQRYEAGWRHRGVTADPSQEELAFIRRLVRRYGSFIEI